MVAIFLMNLLFALSFTLSKGVLDHVSPVFFIGVRMIIAGILLCGFAFWVKKESYKIRAYDWFIFLQMAVFHVFFCYVFEFWALESVSPAKDALFFNLAPFITAILAMIINKEFLTSKQWLGLGLGFVGFLPLLMAQAPGEVSLLGNFFISGPEVLLFISVSSGAYGWILLQSLVKENRYSPGFANGLAMFLGGLLTLVVSFMTESQFIVVSYGSADWLYHVIMTAWYLFILILITNILCYTIYGNLLRTYSATFIALTGGMIPIFTALFDWILWGEVITWHFVMTVVLVFIGLVVFYSDELRGIHASSRNK